jgi:DNA-binding transcriptional ArsR family regulator
MSTDRELDAVFKALANPLRRRICDELRLRPLTTKQLCACFPALDRCTVMQHLGTLERAGLVIPVRKGRERFNFLDSLPIQAIHERWIGPHAAAAAELLGRLQQDLEGQAVKETLPTPAGRR